MDSSGTDAPQHCPQQHPKIPATQENHLFWRPGGRTVPERSDHEINGIRRLRPSPGFCPLDWGGQSPRSKVTNVTSSPSLFFHGQELVLSALFSEHLLHTSTSVDATLNISMNPGKNIENILSVCLFCFAQ